MPSMTAITRTSAPSSPPKKLNKGGRTRGALPGNTSPWQRGPTQNHKPRYFNKKKGGKPFHQPYHKRQNVDYPKHDVLLHRLSSPPSPPLLERIGGSAEDEAASTLTNSDQINGVSEAMEDAVDSLSLSATPHFYTPEPGEVERFLESVIGAPPAAPSPSGTVHACQPNKPSRALEFHNLSERLVKVEDTASSVLYSPMQTAVNSPPLSANPTLDQHSLLGDAMSPPSASAVEECKRLLVPVLLASAQARDPARRLDPEQCLRLLSDGHCRNFIQKAKEMRLQLSSLLSQKTPVNQDWGGSLKREREGEADEPWTRKTRSRFDSVNTVASDVPRRDSDITLVDVTAARSPPKAPRAMLQTSQLNISGSAQDGAPYQTLAASPTVEEPSNTSLIELVYQAIQMFPMPTPSTGHPMTETDTTDVSMGQPTADPPGESTPMPVSPIQPAPSSSAEFVSHLPTQPGVWFKQQGRRFAEIVNVEIEVSSDMFHLSTERQPSRLRTPLRLCSVLVGAMTNNDSGAPAALCDVDVLEGMIARHTLQWPKKGKLVVQVNPESERSKTWLPYALEVDPLDVTACVRPGKNVFRFIQLSDLSEFHFVLVASPPPAEEEWRSWDWASVAGAHRTRASSATGDPTNSLSEFAYVPITIHS